MTQAVSRVVFYVPDLQFDFSLTYAYVAFLVSLALFVYVLRELHRRGTHRLLLTFSALMAVTVLYTGVTLLALMIVDLRWTGWLHHPLFALGQIYTIILAIFAMEYTDRSHWITKPYLGFVGLVIVVFALQELLIVEYRPTSVVTAGSLELARFERVNVLFGAEIVIGLIVLAHLFLALGLFGSLLLRSQSLYRKQGLVIISALGVSFLLFTATDLTESLTGYPITALAQNEFAAPNVVIPTVAFAYAIFRFKMLGLIPLARKNVVEEMGEGYVVIDEGIIQDFNPAAERILDSDGDLLGSNARSVLPQGERILDPDGPAELTVELGDGERFVSLSVQQVTRDGTVAQVVILTDITELKHREQTLESQREELQAQREELLAQQETLQDQQETLVERERELEMLNRVVRHDIQNDMNVVLGYAQVIEAETDHQDMVEPIISGSQHAIELCETVRDLLETIIREESADLDGIWLEDVLTNELEKARMAHEEAMFDYENNADPDLEVRANRMLSSIFTNLFNNAVQHNDADSPMITVTVTRPDETSADCVRIEVADNGPGVPEDNRDEIFGRGEKGLESAGTGVGLYLVDQLTEQYGGRVWIEDNPPRGSIFVVELPIWADEVDGETPESGESG